MCLTDLSRLAQIADELVENLEAKVDKLAKSLEQLNMRFNQMSRNFNRGHSISCSRPKQFGGRSKSPAASGYCFIHKKYGKAARNCIQPCTWQEEFQLGN